MRNEQEYIYTVYQKGSFSKAAQALYLTQPALSLAIQRVENETGVPLFDRTQKPLRLTEAGRLYIESLEKMKVLEEELSSRLHDLSSMNTGHVRIGATSYLLSCILPPVMLRFKKCYPGVKLDIVEAGSYELRERLRNQQLDITFISHWSKDMDFATYSGFQDRILLAVPASLPINEGLQSFALTSEDVANEVHLKENWPSVDLAAFRDTPFVLMETNYNLRTRVDSFFQQSGFEPNICLEVSQIVTAYALARAEIGATFIPDRVVARDCGDLVFYKLGLPLATRNMRIATNERSYLSVAAKKFIEMFAEYYQMPK